MSTAEGSFSKSSFSSQEPPFHPEDEQGIITPGDSESDDAQPIAGHMLGDQPAKSEEDRLGFGTYVSAVAQFLLDSSTHTPLTLSIEGLWGSGKTSFMLQLQESLKASGRTRIVNFNAWQYNADEGLWAAFIHEFDEELSKQLVIGERVRARWKLFRLRARWQGWVATLTTLFWMLAALIAFITIAAYLAQGGLPAFQALLNQSGEIDKSAVKTIGLVGGIGGATASLLLFLSQLKVLFKSPASLDRAVRLFAKPDYSAQLPLIHQVTRDFNSLVKAYAGTGDVYVFIDDLDRCEYAKAAELMQALMMLLSRAPNIALIVGLDRDKVAAAMATKQQGLIPYLYNIAPANAYTRGMEYGQQFIEKFIQVSFVLPTPLLSGLKAMINPDVEELPETLPESQKSEKVIRIVTGKEDSKTLSTVIEMAAQVFDQNPRNVKQFANMFRLQTFIANETGLFGSWRPSTRSGRPLTISQFGKFVLLCMRWPDFVKDAIDDPDMVGRLEASEKLGEKIPEREAHWLGEQKLMGLLRFGLRSKGRSKADFSLEDVNFELLSLIAPPRPKSAAVESGATTSTAPQDPAPSSRSDRSQRRAASVAQSEDTFA
jgi:KAP family P-loop domain